MKGIPDSCSRCGAPIKWHEGSSSINCEFCGTKNYIKDDLNHSTVTKNNLFSNWFNKKRGFLITLIIIIIPVSYFLISKAENEYLSKNKKGCQNKSANYLNEFTAKKAYSDCMKQLRLDYKEYKAEKYNKLANEKIDEGDRKSAIKYFSKAIRVNPKASYYHSRGDSKSYLNDIKGQLKDYSKAIEIDPVPSNYHIRGDLKGKLNDIKGEMEDYTKAIEISPSYKNYSLRSDKREFRGDYGGAINDITNLISKTPYHNPDRVSSLYYRRGDLKTKINDYNGAIQDLTKAITKAPKRSKSLILRSFKLRGETKVKILDYDGALEDYSNSIKYIPRNKFSSNSKKAAMYIEIANILIIQERIGEAIDNYSKAIDICKINEKNVTRCVNSTWSDWNSEPPYIQRAQAKIRLNNTQGAVDDYIKAIERDIDAYRSYEAFENLTIKLDNLETSCNSWERLNKVLNKKTTEFFMVRDIKGVSKAEVATKLKECKTKLENLKDAKNQLTPTDKKEREAEEKKMEQEKKNKLDAQGYYDSATAKYYYSNSFIEQVNGCADYRKASKLGYQLKDGFWPKKECSGNSDSATYYSYGRNAFSKKQYIEAINLYNKGIRLNPFHSKLYNARSNAKYKLGEIEGACNDRAKAIELGITTPVDLKSKVCRPYE